MEGCVQCNIHQWNYLKPSIQVTNTVCTINKKVEPFWNENRKMLEIWIIDLYWSKELTLAGMWINKDLGKWGNEALIRSRVLSKSILGNFLLYAFWPPPHHLSTILVHGARLICSKSNMWAQRPAPSLPGRYARPKRLS